MEDFTDIGAHARQQGAMAGGGLEEKKPRSLAFWIFMGCGTLVVLITLLIAGIFAAVFGSMRNSEVYQMSSRLVMQNEQVQAKLGTPMESGWLVTGSINVDTSSGEADLSYAVTGPLGEATVRTKGEKTGSEWRLTLLIVKGDDWEILLVPPAEAIPEG